MQRQRGLQRQHGFSLIEIMMVLGIVGLLAGIGVPTYTRQMPKYRLYAATRQVLADLQLAQKEAMSQRHMVQVFFFTPKRYLVWQDRNHNARRGRNEVTMKAVREHGVTLSANNSPRFHPSGTVTNLPTVILQHAGKAQKLTRCITISIAGRIKQGPCHRKR